MATTNAQNPVENITYGSTVYTRVWVNPTTAVDYPSAQFAGKTVVNGGDFANATTPAAAATSGAPAGRAAVSAVVATFERKNP
jgi:hypothetical protein